MNLMRTDQFRYIISNIDTRRRFGNSFRNNSHAWLRRAACHLFLKEHKQKYTNKKISIDKILDSTK